MSIRAGIEDWMAARTSPEPNSGCWLWLGNLDKEGYGRFKIGNRTVAAHRVAYESACGSIPDGLVIDHLCRVRCCVNPAHLEAVTNRLNIMRGVGAAALNARKLYCDSGHELFGDNCRIDARRRACRACNTASASRVVGELPPVLRTGPWSVADDEVLIEGVRQGMTFAVIAPLVGRSRSAACGRAMRLRKQGSFGSDSGAMS